jgi:Restriction alleviation protein Lar
VSEKLLPCPFCGSDPVIDVLGGPGSFYRTINCPKCKCDLHLYPMESVAIIAWNTRTPDPRIAVLRKALEAIVPEDEDWWCPTCKVSLASSRVTSSECCDTCGTYLGGVNTPDWIKQAREALEQTKEKP